MSPDGLADVPDRLRAALLACASGEVPPNVALMRLILEAGSAEEVASGLASARAAAEAAEAGRLDRAASLLRDHPEAFATIKGVIAEADHRGAAASPEAEVERWAAVFDRLAASSPDAGVALYGLGSPALLAEASSEVVELMRRCGLLGPRLTILDLGCGAGRLAAALAPRVGQVIGLDVSAGMLREAETRCARLGNVRFLLGTGRDLGPIPDEAVDTALAADVFPYLVGAGGDLAARHVGEIARVLRPGGSLLVLNYSYRGDFGADRGELASLASAAGLALERAAGGELTTWDAATFLIRKPG